MSFLYPSFLFGLLATAVPIAIHLFNFRRTRRVFFTNVALLKTVQTETKSFRRLKHWLILLARVLFLACLVLAFAQPFLPSQSRLGLSRQGTTSLYLDNSYSMQNEQNEKRYLDIATSKLDQLLTLFRNATSLQMLTNDFSAQEQQIGSAEAIRDRVTSVRFAHTSRPLESVYKRQRNLLASLNPGGRNQLFWFSDFQKSTAGDLSRLKIDTTDQLFLVPMNAQSTRNVYVDSVWLNTPFIRELQNNSLTVKLSNSGGSAVKNLPVRLYLDDVQVSTASVNINANGSGQAASATATLNFNVTKKGYHRGRIVFEDYPITFDNEYFFVIEASPSIRVLHLYGERSAPGTPDRDYVEAVYKNDSLFVRKSASAQNFDVGLLKTTDLIVLEGVAQVSGTLRSELERFARQGGSVVIIPPANPSASSYGPFLSALGVSGLTTLTQPLAPSQPLSDPDRKNPFFADVFQQTYQQDPLNLPSATPVWQWNAGTRLLSLRDGRPFLTQSRAGAGYVYVLANPLAEPFGNLAQHALFVPVMYKIAALSARPQRTAYSFDETLITIPVSGAAGGSEQAVYKLKRGKLDIIPVQRVVGNQLLLEMPKSNQLSAGQEVESGYYELQLAGKTERLLALNHGHQESAMAFYSPTELRQVFGNQKNVEVFDSITDGDFVQVLERENLGTNLWKHFLLAALGFLLLEIGLVRFMKG